MASKKLKSEDKKNFTDIPDVYKYKRILEAASEGRLVVFIGAGVSRLLGCPSWDELALKRLKDLYDKKAINFYEYESLKSFSARKLLSICDIICKEEGIKIEGLKTLIQGKPEKEKEYKKIYDNLYKFNAIYITTNYDEYLDECAKKPEKKPVTSLDEISSKDTTSQQTEVPNKIIYSKEKLLISELTNGKVIHIHGSVKDDKNTIITLVDYIKHYQYNTEPPVLLDEVFSKYTVLFIGYGIEEFEILEFIINKCHHEKQDENHFWLYPVFKNDSLFYANEKYYKTMGIKLIPYYKDELGYAQLAKVIENWAKIIGPISRPQNFYDRIKIMDEVL